MPIFSHFIFDPCPRFSQRKLGSASPDKSPTKISHDKHDKHQRQHSDDSDMEATLGPQHGKFEAKAPEIEDLKLRVEALQAQVTSRFTCYPVRMPFLRKF